MPSQAMTWDEAALALRGCKRCFLTAGPLRSRARTASCNMYPHGGNGRGRQPALAVRAHVLPVSGVQVFVKRILPEASGTSLPWSCVPTIYIRLGAYRHGGRSGATPRSSSSDPEHTFSPHDREEGCQHDSQARCPFCRCTPLWGSSVA